LNVEEQLREVARSPHDSRSIISMAEILQDLVTKWNKLETRVRDLVGIVSGLTSELDTDAGNIKSILQLLQDLETRVRKIEEIKKPVTKK